MSSKKIVDDIRDRKKKGSRLDRFLKWLEQGRMKAVTPGCKT